MSTKSKTVNHQASPSLEPSQQLTPKQIKDQEMAALRERRVNEFVDAVAVLLDHKSELGVQLTHELEKWLFVLGVEERWWKRPEAVRQVLPALLREKRRAMDAKWEIYSDQQKLAARQAAKSKSK